LLKVKVGFGCWICIGGQLPPMFNMAKSQLQCYAESIYCTASDLLSNINSGETPLDRLILVVAWAISTTRPLSFGVAPYNPTLGETHHVSNGNLNLLMEQVLYVLICTQSPCFIIRLFFHFKRKYGLGFVHGCASVSRFHTTLLYLPSMPLMTRKILVSHGVTLQFQSSMV